MDNEERRCAEFIIEFLYLRDGLLHVDILSIADVGSLYVEDLQEAEREPVQNENDKQNWQDDANDQLVPSPSPEYNQSEHSKEYQFTCMILMMSYIWLVSHLRKMVKNVMGSWNKMQILHKLR